MQATVCELNKCTGCAACLEVCHKNAIRISDSMKAYNAVIDTDKCIGCNTCHKICQNNSIVEAKKPDVWYQGWTKSRDQRLKSSSGGVATALARYFVENGGIVCSCLFRDGSFIYDFAESIEEIDRFTGSKYVKSNPAGIYKKTKSYLLKNKKVLFIGLPCHASALKKFVGESLATENLYLVDLICHGSPSPKSFNLFLSNKGVDINDIKHITFREKATYTILQDEKYVEMHGVYDSYTLAFLNGISFTENCYSCNYAKLERTTDITLGDAWGSNLTDKEAKEGISLMLCQSEKGLNLLQNAGIELFDVDLDNAIAHNHQLERPYVKPKKYDLFFDTLLKKNNYDKAVRISLSRTYRNQQIKKMLIKLGVRFS